MYSMNEIITYNGEQYEVIGIGWTDPENGRTYYHLASLTKHVKQRNGQRPLMIGVWI